MPDLDLHQLRAFVAVSRHGSVARAAEALHLTASPVSRTLRELERMTGPLFERGYHEMQLTEQGRRLLPFAVGTVRQADDLRLLAQGVEPPLRWAATPWVPDRFAAALREAAEATGTAIEVDGAVSAQLLQQMVHGEIDAAVVHLPVSADGLGSVPIARYRFTLAVPSDDPLAEHDSAAPSDLVGRRVLLLPTSMQPAAMSRLRQWAIEAGAGEVEEVGLADLPLLAGRLRRERAVTFAVEHSAVPGPSGPGIRHVPLTGDPIEFLLGVAWRRDDPVRRDRLERVAERMRTFGADSVIA